METWYLAVCGCRVFNEVVKHDFTSSLVHLKRRALEDTSLLKWVQPLLPLWSERGHQSLQVGIMYPLYHIDLRHIWFASQTSIEWAEEIGKFRRRKRAQVWRSFSSAGKPFLRRTGRHFCAVITGLLSRERLWICYQQQLCSITVRQVPPRLLATLSLRTTPPWPNSRRLPSFRPGSCRVPFLRCTPVAGKKSDRHASTLHSWQVML